MVGDGELRSRVERQVAAPAYRAKMSLLGWAHDLPSFYADVDLVALTSRQEGTPLVLLEAMACRKPFVATNVGGIRDLMLGASCKMNGFEIFENGILADPTPAAVAAAIRHVLTRPQLARQMGEAGREFAARSFSQQRLAQDIESLYEMLVRKKASPARQTQLSS
jgi:glycosyltransferase involved in cell wall biosynthesis